MKKYIFLTIAIVTSTFLSAQNSDKAKALLDDVYTKVSGYENIFVDFRFELKNRSAQYNIAMTAAAEHLTALMADTFYSKKETLA